LYGSILLQRVHIDSCEKGTGGFVTGVGARGRLPAGRGDTGAPRKSKARKEETKTIGDLGLTPLLLDGREEKRGEMQE